VKIATIVGARPQFIKAAVLSRALTAQGVSEILIHTGQHYDPNMSEVFFDELDIARPAHNLGVGGGTHGQNTGRMIEKIEEVLLRERPDWVLVYGDTDSTLAGAIAAAKLHIRIAHVEAGLRSFNRRMPEEINRVLTDHASDLLFAPTQTAVQNLAREGVDSGRIARVGDVMYDAALYYAGKAEMRSGILRRLGYEPKSYILATLHRPENTDDRERLRIILKGLGNAPTPIIWPIHPRTRNKIAEFGLTIPENVAVIEPVGYLDMIMLEKHAVIIATDSGGVQKEAYFHKVPCVTLRAETEWVELVEAGVNVLQGGIPDLAQVEVAWPAGEPLYGDGNSARMILARLAEHRASAR
jgi:UDP-GlcNAc3NAcA epimerase